MAFWRKKMKKILVVFALFAALIFVASCGENSKNDDSTNSGREQGTLYGECYQNTTCNIGLECDIENNICIKETEKPETDLDNLDNDDDNDLPECEVGEFTCKTDSLLNKEYSVYCGSDFNWYLFEPCKEVCDISIGKCNPWKDPDTGLTWSSKITKEMAWDDAVLYCEDLNEGNYSKWRLPTIDELRTLIKNCPQTVSEGSCKVSADNDCLSSECQTEEDCNGCVYDSDEPNNYSKLDYFHSNQYPKYWSSSQQSNDYPSTISAWLVDFSVGGIYLYVKDSPLSVRCVK